MRTYQCVVWMAAAVLAVHAGAADAAISLSYVGSFQLPGDVGNYSWGSLAYDNSGAQEVLYYSNHNPVTATSIPALLDPGVVGWSGLNVGSVVYGPTNNDRPGGSAIIDGTLYTLGYSHWYSNDLALATPTDMGSSGLSNIAGGAVVPDGFLTALEVAEGLNPGDRAGYNMLVMGNYYSQPQMYVAAPQLAAGGSVSADQFFWLRGSTPVWHWDSRSAAWVPDPASADWQDARLLIGERDTTDSTYDIAFYDPVALLTIGEGQFASAVDPATARTAEFDLTPCLSPSVDASYGAVGMAYDPATGRLFLAERSGEAGGDFVHVFQVPVPEPATIGLLGVGIAVLRLRIRRRS